MLQYLFLILDLYLGGTAAYQQIMHDKTPGYSQDQAPQYFVVTCYFAINHGPS